MFVENDRPIGQRSSVNFKPTNMKKTIPKIKNQRYRKISKSIRGNELYRDEWK